MKDSGLSPEQLGPHLHLSSMTLRRLLRKPDSEEIPAKYLSQMREGVYRLIIEDRLKPESVIAKMVVSESPSLSFEAAIRSIGFCQDAMTRGGSHSEHVMIGVSQIGASPERQGEVDRSSKQVSLFRRLGSEWAQRLDTLYAVVSSTKLNSMDKIPAYGALFYLITVFDLIPDTIPVFGLLDDFAVLGIVAAYYVKRFPQLFKADTGL